MPLNPASKYLVDSIQGLPILDGRFEDLKLVNYDSIADVKRGCFSLVFRARDTSSNSLVAVKFYDPSMAMDMYRLTAFRREHEILGTLSGEARCLQLISGLQSYDLNIKVSAGTIIPIKCEYFVISWLEEEIDKFFLCQDSYSPIERLQVFKSMTLAVEALHVRGVFHRDLKPDNLRSVWRFGHREVVAIDLGTAAKYSSTAVQNPYNHPAGAGAYASPEAHCRLAGNRLLAKYTDIYALGCMLFELFSPDLHIKAVLDKNNHYQLILGAMQSSIDVLADDLAQKVSWDSILNRSANSYVAPKLEKTSGGIPPGVAPIVNEVLCRMAHFDYRQRPSLDWVRNRVDSAIRVLQNDRIYRARLERAKDLRRKRLEAVQAKIDRFNVGNLKRLQGIVQC